MASKKQSSLKLNKALDFMRAGSCLLRPNGNQHHPATDFYVVPGGLVTEHVAEAIMKRPDVRGEKDGLFPGHDQTWRIVT